jgi:hypothetical protein
MKDFRFSKPENTEYNYNSLLPFMPDPSAALPGHFAHMKAGRGITKEAIGKVALLDFEHNLADLREHLPRPFGRVIEVFPNGYCSVQVGTDPYEELREAHKEFEARYYEQERALDELDDELSAANRAVGVATKKFECERELRIQREKELETSKDASKVFARALVARHTKMSQELVTAKNNFRNCECIAQVRLNACERYENQIIPDLQKDLEDEKTVHLATQHDLACERAKSLNQSQWLARIQGAWSNQTLVEVGKAIKGEVQKPEPKPQKFGIFFRHTGALTDAFQSTYNTEVEAQDALGIRINQGFCTQSTYIIEPIV